MLDILRKRHRRLILLLVKDTVVETEVDVMVRDRDGAEPTEMELFHNHLPKLADAKYIEWDREAGTISEGPRFDEIKPLLELLEPHVDEPPADWS
ncbi:hypothetical protein [Natronomonas sp.]|uniref:DUF7344 domain-containing protein n=1 Tax=Natronomonas sp. TaxID=2184060 RepID=UPI0039772007